MSTRRRGLIGGVLAGLAGCAGAIVLAMLFSSDPQFASAPDMSAEALAKSGLRFDQPYPSEPRSFALADGSTLRGQYLRARAPAARTTVLFVHGLLGASFLLNASSGLLREAVAVDGSAEVVAIDLRGHGLSDGARGDIAHVGQYETDLGEIVAQLRGTPAGGRVLLAGHSMGGGIALRYAQQTALPPVDGYVLFAPYLGWASPTTRRSAPPDAERFMRLHVPRLLGLKLLNALGITAFNGLRTQFFNLPSELPLRSYSFRASESMAPSDYRAALACVRAPLLALAGTRDEAFEAAEYPRALAGHARAQVSLIPGATHNSVTYDGRALDAVHGWAQAFEAATPQAAGATRANGPG